MIVAIHQPQYMPWLGYFDKMDRCDVFVMLDNVQYKKREFQNRNRIKTAQGWQWITVPLNDRYLQKLNEVKINRETGWQKKHLHALELNYRRSRFFDEYIGIFRGLFAADWDMLSELNMACIRLFKDMLGIDSEIVIASELGAMSEEPTMRLVDICRKLGADTYLSGRDGRNYMDLTMFGDAGMKVVFQEFRHPVYPQLFGDFEYFMSAIDLLFNCGSNSINLLRGEGTS